MGESRRETLNKTFKNGARSLADVPIEFLDKKSFPPLDSLATLIDHPYWRRAWIQQELQAVEDVWLHCGSSRIHIFHLTMILNTLLTAKGRLSGRSLQIKSKSIRRTLDGFPIPISFMFGPSVRVACIKKLFWRFSCQNTSTPSN